MASTLTIPAGKSSTGQLVFEEVLVEPLDGGRYRILRSPGLALGIASGDIFELDSAGRIRILKRAGNVAVQLFVNVNIAEVEQEASRRLARLHGSLDGKTAKQLVYTVPASVGFPQLEAALNALIALYPTAQWFYGNVYDPVDGTTPLGWWNDA